MIAAVLIPGILAVLPACLAMAHFFATEDGFGSLADVALLFEEPPMLLAGWVHRFLFDLFIGA